ncbi:hypothetical protein E5Q_05722 [Mixia osmundae IAM 14324]|uniref:Major facilitator superfamily (MFS) profile domain-containing protein n=1 Tax=Mixia osmundae (strain CBS 9802 / IAM 14324 / JCM 22182 / KY 12970) TaxID=764103 RepID=G7E873_MIXOS|nr:hypothetical protein E5Q_05722 [Mixia osmundae IAM 14324]
MKQVDEPLPDAEPDERTPLLARRDAGEAGQQVAASRTPLPVFQVFILCSLRFCEPVGMALIFPFVNQQLVELGIADEDNVGYLSGVIESLFSLAQFATILQIGRLSDRIGRKPVILGGLAGVTLSATAFGLSQSFAAMAISRALAGGLNGNAAVIKSMLAELTDETNQGLAFSFLPLSWALGTVVAPLIGGLLPHPVERYPRVFGRSTFLKAYPYFLPCFVGALFPLFGVIVGSFFLKETLPSRVNRELDKGLGGEGQQEIDAHDGLPPPPPVELVSDERPTVLSLLRDQQIVAILVAYSFLALQTISLAALVPLFGYTPIRLGGLSLSEPDLGAALSFQGFAVLFFQVIVFPIAQRRMGTLPLYRSAMAMYPFVFVLLPVTHLLAKQQSDRTGLWIFLLFTLLVSSIGNMVFGCNMIIVNGAAPSQAALGTLNGLAQSCAALVRAIGPAASTALFAFGIDHHILGGLLIWVLLFAVSLCAFASTFALKDNKAAWRQAEPRSQTPSRTPRQLSEESSEAGR